MRNFEAHTLPSAATISEIAPCRFCGQFRQTEKTTKSKNPRKKASDVKPKAKALYVWQNMKCINFMRASEIMRRGEWQPMPSTSETFWRFSFSFRWSSFSFFILVERFVGNRNHERWGICTFWTRLVIFVFSLVLRQKLRPIRIITQQFLCETDWEKKTAKLASEIMRLVEAVRGECAERWCQCRYNSHFCSIDFKSCLTTIRIASGRFGALNIERLCGHLR